MNDEKDLALESLKKVYKKNDLSIDFNVIENIYKIQKNFIFDEKNKDAENQTRDLIKELAKKLNDQNN